MPSILEVAWGRYLKQLEQKPLKTKAVTAGALAAASDVLAQRLTFKGPLNWRRTLAIALFGLVWSGPSNHYWQRFLEQLFPGRRDGAAVLQKVAVDQLVYGPLCNVLFMSYISMFVEGRSLSFTQSKLRQDWLATQLHGWKVWPLAALLNYRYVPLKLRVLFVNLVAFAWSTFLITRSRAASSMIQLVKVPAAK